MPGDVPHDLRRVAFFKNKDGSPAKDRKGNALRDPLGMPARRNFSPIWAMVGPEGGKVDGEIPERYHAAAILLANCNFFRKTWGADHDGAKFLMIRDEWIRACEAARAHDWDENARQHEYRGSLGRKASDLGKASRKFQKALETCGYGAPQKLAFFLWAAFENRTITEADASTLTSTVPTDAILQALDRFANDCETPRGRGTGNFQFGPIVYPRLPLRLPDREVALATELADLFSCWRSDTDKIRPDGGRVPTLSKGTPWKPLAAFVDATFGNNQPTRDLIKRVQAACEHGVKIWGLPKR